MSRRVFVAGGHITPFIGKGNPNFIHKKHPDFGKKLNPSVKDYIVQSVTGAFSSTGVSAEAIDRVYVGNFAGELFNQQGHLGVGVEVQTEADAKTGGSYLARAADFH